jgi:hypothetical protein
MIEKFHSMRFGQRVKGKGALSPFHLYEPLMGDNEHAALTALDHPQFSDEKSFGFDGGDKDWSTELIAAALSSPFGSVRTKAENKFGSRRRRGGIGIATDRELRRASNLHDYRKKEGQLHPNETFDYRDVFNRMFGG